MNQRIKAVAEELEQDQSTLERELSEIELLLTQTTSEAERHEARRVQAEERVTTLEREAGAEPQTIADARVQLLSQTRRATFMLAQLEVLTGKQRALQRYQQRLVATLPVLREAADQQRSDGSGRASAEVLAAQEQMRREIARQMHDGPAQSIANIALQAQIVQRLFDLDPERAKPELGALVDMVSHALDATKEFIFEVRPMVLDDLGLVPTLRRAAAERSRRGGVLVRFESVGTDRRLPTELESTVFRIIDDAVVAYTAAHPREVLMRLDWHERGLRVAVRGRPPEEFESGDARARATVDAARRDRSMPVALASMIREQQSETEAQRARLPDGVWRAIGERAAAVGISIRMSADRWLLEAEIETPA